VQLSSDPGCHSEQTRRMRTVLLDAALRPRLAQVISPEPVGIISYLGRICNSARVLSTPKSTNARLLCLSHPLHPSTCPLPQFMEQRKRPHVDGPETAYPKKRAALDSNGTPSHVNGVSHLDEPKDGDNLEVRDLPCYERMCDPKLNRLRCSARRPSSAV